MAKKSPALKNDGPRLTEQEALGLMRMRGSEGELEFDPNALVSVSQDGAYVQAWVWFYKTDLPTRLQRRCAKEKDS